MPQGQGQRLVEKEVDRIKSLLANTDMTFIEIAERVGHSRSVVRSINNKFKIRRYLGRIKWIVEKENTGEGTEGQLLYLEGGFHGGVIQGGWLPQNKRGSLQGGPWLRAKV